jgi:anthranilate phosphoribosyltransferase
MKFLKTVLIIAMSELKKYIIKLTNNKNLTYEEAGRAMQIVLGPGSTPAQIASYVTALKVKGETPIEIAGSANAVLQKSYRLNYDNVLSIKGTGNLLPDLLNISLLAEIIIAATGVKIIDSGLSSMAENATADILETLGVNIKFDISGEEIKHALDTNNIVFQKQNKLLHNNELAFIRFELGFKSIIDLMLPFAVPVKPKYHLYGAHDRDLHTSIAEALIKIGIKKAWIVTSDEGMDKLSISGKNHITEVSERSIRKFTISPEELGIKPCKLESLYLAGSKLTNSSLIHDILHGQDSDYQRIALINAAAGLVVAEKVDNIYAGLELAKKALESHKAFNILKEWVNLNNSMQFSNSYT